MRDDVLARLAALNEALGALPVYQIAGRVIGVAGLTVEIAGLSALAGIGQRVRIEADGETWRAEIVGIAQGIHKALVYGHPERLRAGLRVVMEAPARSLRAGAANPFEDFGALAVSEAWLGRVIDPLGQPIDGKGPLPSGPHPLRLRANPPLATERARLGGRLDLGVKALNVFTTAALGQRLGLFAASGIGKSTLLSMIARFAVCDVVVLALIGERGREVREFIEEHLGAEKAARSVVVVATSDAPPLLRRDCAYAATTIAEYFRDQGRSVLLVMDSLTRFCQALREIALSSGEFPAARGFPPSVFTELPRLLERAGPGRERPGELPGYITGLYTVLVDGDDHDEPIADAVRGILDGHIVLSRRIAEAGRYPPIDVLRSLSRTMSQVTPAEEMALAQRGRAVLARYGEIKRLWEMGVYEKGRNGEFDALLELGARLEAFLAQDQNEPSLLETGFAELAALLGTSPLPSAA
jgi:flagellum-specific ATP synthase